MTFLSLFHETFHELFICLLCVNSCVGVNSCWKLTINVPVVFEARYLMVLRSATSLLGAMEGVGPENRDFFGP